MHDDIPTGFGPLQCRLKGTTIRKERIAARRVGKQRQKSSRVSLPCDAN